MNPLTVIFLVVMSLMAITVAAFLRWENRQIRAKQEAQYEKLHDQIQNDFMERGNSEHDLMAIHCKMRRLSKMPHKNREKERLLSEKYLVRYNAWYFEQKKSN